MMRILFRDRMGHVNANLIMGDLAGALEDKEGLLWLDLANVPTNTVEPILAKTFGFHPLAIDDALHESHVPKIDDWQDYLYIVFRTVSDASSTDRQLSVPELDIFLGSNFLVTYSQKVIPSLDQLWNTVQKDERWLKRGTGYLLYRLVDELTDQAVFAVDDLQDELEAIEDQIFAEANQEVLERLFTLKRGVLQLRRIMVPQRDVLNRLSRNEYQTIDASDRVFFRDVYDHLLRLDTLLDDLVILVGGARDSYLSVVNNRMNDVMKTLTVITALFMPLAFITGFFGMNFFQAATPLVAWTSELAFILVLATMVFIPLVMLFWMRHRSWI